MSTTRIFDYVVQTPLSIAIAILYVMFFWRLSDHISQASEMEKAQRDMRWSTTSSSLNSYTGEYQQDKTKNDKSTEEAIVREKVKAAQFKKHWMLLLAGVVGICISASVGSSSTRNGVGWGSVACIFSAICIQWHNYQERQKLYICGGGLGALLLFATAMLPEMPHGTNITTATATPFDQ